MFTSLLVACATQPDSFEAFPGISSDEAPPFQSGQVRQWASDAEASSEFSVPEWAALQAIGAPDTPRCGDYQTAWATAGSDTVDTLEVSFPVSVHVTGINIIQSFNPNQIVLVELVGLFDRNITVFERQPIQVDQPCPFVLSIPVEKTERQFNRVRVTVDQSVLGMGWNQIDAVELIGDTE